MSNFLVTKTSKVRIVRCNIWLIIYSNTPNVPSETIQQEPK